MSKSFITSIRKFKGTVEDATVVLHKRVALDLLRFTAKKTPVDSGLLRANWNLGLNAPIKKIRGKTTKRKDGSKSLSGVTGNLGSYKKIANSNISRLKLGDTVFMNNPVKYAAYVEFGTDSTPPRAMLSRSIEEVKVKYL